MSDSHISQPQPVVIPTGQITAGFPTSPAQPGSEVLIETCGYHTFDEGLDFYNILEGFNEYVKCTGMSQSCIDRILVCISKEKTYIYANDQLPMTVVIRAKGPINAGENIYKDDIAAIQRLDFPNLQPPTDCGFLLLISAGWRRGMCFDLRSVAPVSTTTSEAAFDSIKQMGGLVLTHLHYTEKFLLSNKDWGQVLKNGWFPFVFLPHNLWENLFLNISNGWSLQKSEEMIHDQWLGLCDDRLESWRSNEYFSNHAEFFSRAVSAYKEQDWLTVVSVAAPRVEGLMRMAFDSWHKQRKVIDCLSEQIKQQEHNRSLLFPDRLKQYLNEVFFRFTKFNNGDLPATRHTLAHGLASSESIDRKVALTLLLLIDHLFYCMPLGNGD